MRSPSSDTTSYSLLENWRESLIFSTALKCPSFTSHIQLSKYFQNHFNTCRHCMHWSEQRINVGIFFYRFCQNTMPPLSLHIPTLQGLWGLGIIFDNFFYHLHAHADPLCSVNSTSCTKKKSSRMSSMFSRMVNFSKFPFLFSQQMHKDRTGTVVPPIFAWVQAVNHVATMIMSAAATGALFLPLWS